MYPGIKLFDLTGRVAIVTGGSKGLGEAMAAGLASAGARLLIVGRDGQTAEKTAQKIASDYGGEAIALAVDVCDPEAVNAMTERAIQEFGQIDILVNNAGINLRGPIDELADDVFRQVQQTNVEGVWRCCKAVVPHLKRQRRGRIINLASTLGVVGLEDRTPYAASKGAVVQLTRALAVELASWNITVNAICPGPFLTEMNESIKDSEHAKENIIGAVAMRRWGELHEIQGAAIYLASDASSFTTGSLMFVDGGWTAR